MKNNAWIIGSLLFCLLIGTYLWTKASANKNDSGHHEAPVVEGKFSLSGKLENGVRVVPIKASRYKFEPDSIVVRMGEKVRLEVTSTDGNHGLAIADFKVNIFAPEDKTEAVEFIADKKGIFHAHCSAYCGIGHGKMHAMFIVTDSNLANSN